MADDMKQCGQPINYKGANSGHCGKKPIVVLTICPHPDRPFELFNVFMPMRQARKLYGDLRDIFKVLKQEKEAEEKAKRSNGTRIPSPWVPDPNKPEEEITEDDL
jgi:hypothetical protein